MFADFTKCPEKTKKKKKDKVYSLYIEEISLFIDLLLWNILSTKEVLYTYKLLSTVELLVPSHLKNVYVFSSEVKHFK